MIVEAFKRVFQRRYSKVGLYVGRCSASMNSRLFTVTRRWLDQQHIGWSLLEKTNRQYSVSIDNGQVEVCQRL